MAETCDWLYPAEPNYLSPSEPWRARRRCAEPAVVLATIGYRRCAEHAQLADGWRLVRESVLDEAAVLLAAMPDPALTEAAARAWLARRNRWLEGHVDREVALRRGGQEGVE